MCRSLIEIKVQTSVDDTSIFLRYQKVHTPLFLARASRNDALTRAKLLATAE
jgi:hypothetical protein